MLLILFLVIRCMICWRDDGWGVRLFCILYYRGVSVVNYWWLGVFSYVGLVKDDYIRMNVFWCVMGDVDFWNVVMLVFGICDDEWLCLFCVLFCFDIVLRLVVDGRMWKSLFCSWIYECNLIYSGFVVIFVFSEWVGIVLVEGENEC